MTLAYLCIVVAALLPILCAGIAKAGRFGQAADKGGYDNHLPRDWLARQQGYRARANAAQANSFEALPFFIGAVLAAHQLHAPQRWVDLLASIFIVCRLLYIALYVADRAALRSVVWFFALAANIGLMFVGA